MVDRSEKKQKSWTVIIIGTKWGTLSFQVTKKILMVVLVCLSLGIIMAGFSTYEIFGGSGKYSGNADSREWRERQKALEALRKENEGLREKVQVLENQFISIGKKPEIKTEDKPVSEAAPPRPFEVSVEQIKIKFHPEDSSFRFQFTLGVRESKRDRASGYVFLVLKSDRPQYESSVQVFPAVELKNGRPSNYRQGEHFSILRHKLIKGVIKKITDPGIYSTAVIFVFSEDGALLLEKKAEVK
ncbi:MAG: hypothetical protein ACE14T_08465 [Syntrophales bacterium]